MTRNLNLKRALGFGVAVAALAVATAFAIPQATQTVQAAPVADPRGPGGGIGGPSDTYLADALGITAAELQTAQQKAYEAAIQQALDEGLITQAQADQLKNRTGGRGMPGMKLWGADADIDQQALLADALGITTAQLDAAQQKAADARVAQAVTDGRITQEQADLMKAEQALTQYIQDKDLYGKAVAAAVADGVITQTQADAILAARTDGRGFGGPRGGFGDFDGMRGDFGSKGFGGPMRGGQPPAQAPTQAPALGSSS